MNTRDTKTAILEATITLLGREGADGFSASALAKEVGVSKATLFHHFQSLDEIPIAALDLLTSQAMDFDLPEDAGLPELLAAMGDMAFGFLDERRAFLNAFYTFVSKAMFDPRLKEKLQISLNGARAQVRQMFSNHIKDEARARDLSNMVMVLLDGGMMYVLLLDNEAEIRAMWDRFAILLIKEFENENSN
ncbi:MAG: TetR/AcrR family transcriptional regulator [Rhizobiaceae bacterium]|nr:TetR/AcrR family transcriptional regulator [Rhizobiaceae bacterium]